jgi:hypothetical protein
MRFSPRTSMALLSLAALLSAIAAAVVVMAAEVLARAISGSPTYACGRACPDNGAGAGR